MLNKLRSLFRCKFENSQLHITSNCCKGRQQVTIVFNVDEDTAAVAQQLRRTGAHRNLSLKADGNGLRLEFPTGLPAEKP